MLGLDRKTGKYFFAIPDCHTKLNQYGRLSLLQKEKSYRQFYHSHLPKDAPDSPHKHQLKGQDALGKLLKSRRFSQKRRSCNPEHEAQSRVLTEAKVDAPRQLKVAKYEGHIKTSAILNDFHVFATNGGFSRSQTGGIFPK